MEKERVQQQQAAAVAQHRRMMNGTVYYCTYFSIGVLVLFIGGWLVVGRFKITIAILTTA
jgi:hypothetical protein